MAPRSCRPIGWGTALIHGCDSLLLSSEELLRVKTRQRGPANYQPTLEFSSSPPSFSRSRSLRVSHLFFVPLPHPYCSAARRGSCRLTEIATDLINSLILIIGFEQHCCQAVTRSKDCLQFLPLYMRASSMISDCVHQVQRNSGGQTQRL